QTPEHWQPQKSVLGILFEGPSQVGHYVRPAYATASGARGLTEDGPIIRPDGQSHRWAIQFAPDRAGGRGQIEVTFDGQSKKLDLAPGHREQGARFDRFGLITMQRGGHFLQLYVDDLRYTAGPGRPRGSP